METCELNSGRLRSTGYAATPVYLVPPSIVILLRPKVAHDELSESDQASLSRSSSVAARSLCHFQRVLDARGAYMWPSHKFVQSQRNAYGQEDRRRRAPADTFLPKYAHRLEFTHISANAIPRFPNVLQLLIS